MWRTEAGTPRLWSSLELYTGLSLMVIFYWYCGTVNCLRNVVLCLLTLPPGFNSSHFLWTGLQSDRNNLFLLLSANSWLLLQQWRCWHETIRNKIPTQHICKHEWQTLGKQCLLLQSALWHWGKESWPKSRQWRGMITDWTVHHIWETWKLKAGRLYAEVWRYNCYLSKHNAWHYGTIRKKKKVNMIHMK